MSKLAFQHIGLTGHHAGSLSITENGFIWTNKSSTVTERFEKDSLIRICWTVFGSRAHLTLYTNNGAMHRFDGFDKTRYGEISEFIDSNLGLSVEKNQVGVYYYYHYYYIIYKSYTCSFSVNFIACFRWK